MKYFAVTLILFSLFLCGNARELEKIYDESLRDFHFAESAHFIPALHADKKLKLFFVGPYTHMSEADAVRKMFGMPELEAAVTYGAEKIEYEKLPENLVLSRKMFTEMMKKAFSKPYDAIVIGKLPWKNFNAAEQLLILKKVHSGCGLLYFRPGPGDQYLERIFTEKRIPVPEELNGIDRRTDSRITYAQFGKGRIAFVEYQNERNDFFQMIAPSRKGIAQAEQYNQYLIAAGQLAAWTAGCRIKEMKNSGSEKAEKLVADLKINKTSFRRGEILEGKLELLSASSKLNVSLWDNYGRLLASNTVHDSGRISFRFKIPDALTPLHYVKAETFDKDGRLQSALKKEIVVQARSREELDVGMWITRGSGTYAVSRMYEALKNYGVNMIYTYYLPNKNPDRNHADAEVIARNNLLSMPYTLRIIFTGGAGKNVVRTPCLNDPSYRAEVKKMFEAQKGYWQYYPAYYSFGDENALSSGNEADICCCKYCNEDFVRFLRLEYKNLESLNAAWNTSYGDFQEIKPVLLPQAMKNGNLIPWIMHRRHMDKIYADFHEYLKGLVRRFDPAAKVGFEGSLCRSTWGGGDYERLAAVNDFIADYENVAGNEMLAAFGGKKFCSGMMAGGYYPFMADANRCRYIVWQNAFALGRLLLYYADQHFDWLDGRRSGSGLRTDLNGFPWFNVMMEQVAKLRRGPQLLLNESMIKTHGVALLYNRDGEFTATAMQRKNYFGSFIKLIKDCGFQSSIMTMNMLRKTGISKDQYPVLILPDSIYLPSDIVNILEQYMSDGGVVIANAVPEKNDQNQPLNWKNKMIRFQPGDLDQYTGEWGMDTLAEFLYTAEASKIRKAFSKHLKNAEPHRPAILKDSEGKVIWDCEARRYECGNLELLSLLRMPAPDKKAIAGTAELEKKWYVYDILNGKAKGFINRIPVNFTPGSPQLFILSRREIGTFEASASKNGIKFDPRQPGSSFFRINLYDPDGRFSSLYSKTHSLSRDGLFFVPAWAMNDAGVWKIEIIDIVTNIKSVISIDRKDNAK